MSELQTTLLWAGIVGCIGGLSAIAFREAIQGMLWLFTQHTGGLVETALDLPWWQRLLVPAMGGFLAGWVLHLGSQFSWNRHSTDYMEAVALGDGAIYLRPSFVKTFSSLLTVSSGGSIGREGAMVQLSAVLASWLGRHVGRLSVPRLRLLVACGAAAGIAAVYDVTITAALFVAEIVLGSIAMESLGPLLLAATASSLTSRALGGFDSYVKSPPFHFVSSWEVIPYLVIGLILGFAAPGFVHLLRKSEEVFLRVASKPHWRLALGGLAVGALSVAFPYVWGNGRSMVNLVLQNPWPWEVLALILVCKVAATAATAGSGAVGGVFTPTLFTGAMLGGLMGHAVSALWPGQTAGPQAYALVGMGGFLAATTRAPFMAMLMIFEMTLNYDVILPLIVVCVTAYYGASAIENDSIYSESLRRKRARAVSLEPKITCVRDLMKPPPQSVLENAPFPEVAHFFMSQPYNHLFVVSSQHELRGAIVLQDVKNCLQDFELGNLVTACDLMRTDLPIVTPDSELGVAREAFRHYEGERLPVLKSTQERFLIGYVSKTDLLLTFADGVDENRRTTAKRFGRPSDMC